MLRYMKEIYQLTTINYDHIFATLIRYQRAKSFSERAYRNRIFLCARQIKDMEGLNLHSVLEKTYRDIRHGKITAISDGRKFISGEELIRRATSE